MSEAPYLSESKAPGFALAEPRARFPDPVVERLFPVLAEGVHWGLDRTRRALSRLGDPHRAVPAIHVGGTNGKGSVASMVAHVLTLQGHRVGLYTSPHLCAFRERYQVGGMPLNDATLEAHAARVRAAVAGEGLSFFEAATVLAFEAFVREGVDVSVIEVGLGGRLDATNVVRPLVAAVTNVALDHADYLGSSLTAIAREKAGIIKADVPFVTAATEPAVVEVLRETARRRGAPFGAVDPLTHVHHLDVSRQRTSLTLETEAWGSLRLDTPLIGRHQALNCALAVEILERLPEPPGADTVTRGLSTVTWPGRGQIEELGDGTWVFDVAHNTAGIHALVDVLDRVVLPEPLVGLVGVLGDKDWRTMLPPLFRRLDAAVLTQPPSAPPARRWSPARALAEARGDTAARAVSIEEDFGAALGQARGLAGEGTVVVTGSVHTVGDALFALGRTPFEGTTGAGAR